jgi:phosphoribosylpyrophosphate synthetase
MKEYDVVLASGSEQLENRFEELGYRVYVSEMNYDGKRMFPNADMYTRISSVDELSGRRVVVIQSCTGSGPTEKEFYTTSDRMVELLLLLDLLRRPVIVKELKHKEYECEVIEPPSRIDVILTFQPFALQDKAFLSGEAISARWALEAIDKVCDRIWIVNPHAPESLDWIKSMVESGKLNSIDVTRDLIQFGAEKFGFNDYIVVTPDEGGQERFALRGFGKKRLSSYAVELSGDLDVENKDVIIVDDLTKSGSTLLRAGERLFQQGAANVGMAVVHVLSLVGRGEELLEYLLERSEGQIVTTNSVFSNVFCVEHPELTCDIVDALVNALEEDE